MSSRETLRIAFVGADNFKKANIAQAFKQYQHAEGNNLAFLSSDIPHIKRQMGINIGNTAELQFTFQWALLSSQIAKERAITEDHRGFISDCSVIDYLAGAIQKVEDRKLNSNSMFNYFQVARHHLRNYDLIAYVPFTFDDTRYDSQLTNWHDNIKRKRLSDIIYGELIKNDVRFATLDKPIENDNVTILNMYLNTIV